MEEREVKYNEDENDSSSDELKIVLEDENVVEKPRSKKRKRTETTDSSDDEDVPLPETYLKVEENLCTTAAKNNLTTANVKNIIKRVVANEHVMAIVKLREEEMEEEEEAPEPKLTRSKAKELKKITPDMSWPLPLTPVKLIKVTSPEVKKLIDQDLPDEESDEEYQPAPGEHDGSDDERDTVGSQSDVDSQPRTPITPGSALEVDHSPTKYTDDGVFKLPKEISQLNEKEEPTIALRTRSKLCLSDTAIEEIEDSFIPPDDVVPYPMDEDWSEFLAEFTNPDIPSPNKDDDTIEDDETVDPEYNASAEKVKVDSEELRQDKYVKVSQKEVDDLMAELFPTNDGFDIEENFMVAPNSDLLPTSLSSNTSVLPEKESAIKLLDISHSSHILQHNAFQEKTCIEKIAQNISLSAENIEQMSKNNIQYCEMTQCTEPEKNTAETESEIINEKVPLTAPLSIKIENLDRTTRVVSSSVELIPSVKTSSKQDDAKSDKDSDTGKKPVTEEDENIGVFTPEQRQILDQQMRQHVQIVTQNFLQLHGHPELWKHGPKQREYLTELKDLGSDKPHSAFVPINLLPAIDLCNKWQVRLAEDTQEMRDMMQFLVQENMKAIKARGRNSVYYMKFSKQFIETVLDSNVFIYPNLLPKYPFRVEVTGKCDYLTSEDQLLAMGMEQFDKYIEENPKLYRTGRSDQRNRWLSELIACNTLACHGEKALTNRIRYLKRNKPDNPVKYYFKNGKAPDTVHNIIPFDPTWTPRSHPVRSLPETWYHYMKEPTLNTTEVVKRLGVLSDTLEQTKRPVPGQRIQKKGIHNKASYFNAFPSTRDLDGPQTSSTVPVLTLYSPIQILPKTSAVSNEPKITYDAYQLKKLTTNQYVLTPALDPTVIKNILTTSGRSQISQRHLPRGVIQRTKKSSTKKASETNCVNLVIPDGSDEEPTSQKPNCIATLPKSSKIIQKSRSRTEQNKTQIESGQPSRKSSTSGPESPGELHDGVLQENECSGEAFCVSSDGNEECNTTKCPSPILHIESSHSSAAAINESDSVASHEDVPSVVVAHQTHGCPCVQSACTVKTEETLPKNQTLLTHFFKQSEKNDESITSEPVLSKCVVSKRELCETDVSKSTSPTASGDLDRSNAASDAVRNSLQSLKHEVLILEHIPNNTLEFNVPDNSAEGITSSENPIGGDSPQSTRNDSSEPETSSEEDNGVETLNIDNLYNSEQHTLNTVLSKLQCLLFVNQKRGALLRNSNGRQKCKLNSDIAWRIRTKLLHTIEEVENIMLPSMPNLTTPSKSSIDGSDGSNGLVQVRLTADKPNDVAVPAVQEDNKKPAEEKSPRSLRNASRSGISGGQSTKHRLAARAQRELEANKAMFATTDPNTDDLNESSCATAYFEKVQSRLNGNPESYATNKFTEFHDILETFDSTKETPCDLYNKLKTLFGPENDDLTEEFLTFLTAGQAVEINRFMEHFVLTNMSEFIERLKIYFYRRPAQLRKVLWCLERMVENIDKSDDAVTIDSIKSTILPHLKGNKHLVNWFLRLLPGGKLSESQINSGYEVIDVQGLSKNLESGSPNLDYEVLNIPPIEDNYGNDLCTCMCHNSSDEKYRSRSRHCIPCGMKYMQGRLYIQHGRGLRAARVEWGGGGGGQAHRLSAPPPPPSQPLPTPLPGGRRRAASLDPPQPRDSDDERISPKRILRCVRTPPTSKTKYARMSRNSTKLGDTEDTPNRPSCSKNIIRDENLTDSPSRNKNCDNVENLADILPRSEAQEERGVCSELIIKCDAPAPNADSIEETSSQDDGVEVEDMITDSPRSQEALCRNSPFQLEPSQLSEVTNSSALIVKTENVEDLNEEVDLDTDTMEEAESGPVIKLEEEQSWTREEDKAILLVLQSESDSDYTFEKIQRLLPHRSIGEIRDRFQSVMQLLQQMASDNI